MYATHTHPQHIPETYSTYHTPVHECPSHTAWSIAQQKFDWSILKYTLLSIWIILVHQNTTNNTIHTIWLILCSITRHHQNSINHIQFIFLLNWIQYVSNGLNLTIISNCILSTYNYNLNTNRILWCIRCYNTNHYDPLQVQLDPVSPTTKSIKSNYQYRVTIHHKFHCLPF